MKSILKRAMCVGFALCLAASLIACGGNDNTESDTASSTESSKTVSVIDTIDIPSGSIYDDPNWSPYSSMPDSIKGSTVRYATWIDHTQTEGAVPLANIENDIGIKAELYLVPQVGYVNTIMTKMASGDIPDVFKSNEVTQSFPLTLQIAAPINKVSSVDLNDPRWDKTLLDTATIDGNVYLVNALGSPWTGSNLLYFNKSVFEENGFKTPADYYEEGNWTWDTLLKCAKDIKSLGSDYTGVSLPEKIFTDSLGTSFVKYDYATDVFSNNTSDPKLLQGYQWYADAREQGLLDGSTADFVKNKCGLVVIGVYGLKSTGYFMDMDPQNVGFTYLPSMEAGKSGRVSSIYRMYGIIDGAPNADAAGYFLRYWLDYNNYDLGNAFLSTEAGDFYYQIINTTANEKYFQFDDPLSTLLGNNDAWPWRNSVASKSSAGVKSAIDSLSNRIDTAVDLANTIVQDKIVADREKYK